MNPELNICLRQQVQAFHGPSIRLNYSDFTVFTSTGLYRAMKVMLTSFDQRLHPLLTHTKPVNKAAVDDSTEDIDLKGLKSSKVTWKKKGM